MYIRKILYKFSVEQLHEIANVINKYFNLVNSERIFELILQVDSIDIALYLLMYHKEHNDTLDNIVYAYLEGKDNRVDK